MSVAEAAKYIGISTAPMYAITERADCDFLLQVGRKKLILRDRFIAWIDRQAAAGANALR
jgi:hypothetical protein